MTDKTPPTVIISLKGKDFVHIIPMSVFLGEMRASCELRIALHMKSPNSFGRVLFCATEKAMEDLLGRCHGRVTDIGVGLDLIKECDIGPIVESGKISEVTWKKPVGFDVVEASVVVIREIDRESDDCVTITAVEKPGYKKAIADEPEAEDQKQLAAKAAPAKRGRSRRGW